MRCPISSLSFTVSKSHFLYGSFFNALISFAIIAAVVYYLIVSCPSPVD